MNNIFVSNSVDETDSIAADFYKSLKTPMIIGLYGEMGSGKTTFVQSLLKHGGVDEKITSPTFVLQRSYQGSKDYFYHFDLYRLEELAEIAALGLEEVFADKAIVLIEWPEKIEFMLPESVTKISFRVTGENQRSIEIKDETVN